MAALIDRLTDQAYGDMRAFLLDILPDGIEVFIGQENRVPEPEVDDFVVMTATGRRRLATNIDKDSDCTFIGEITALVLTASDVDGKIRPGLKVFGPLLPYGGVTVVAQLTGTAGGDGTYSVATGTADVVSSEMAAGVTEAMQETELSMQLDVHGPKSADFAVIISTLFRDEVAVDFFGARGNGVTPFYADDPQQLPFVNENQQVETRWVMDARMQINPTVTVQQQFAEVVEVGLINVDVEYPPAPSAIGAFVIGQSPIEHP